MTNPPKAFRPHIPAKWELADASAIQALVAGTAEPEQQKRALDFIINNICGTYDLSHFPDSDADTRFALGKQFAGQQIVKLTKVNLATLRRTTNDN